MISKKDYSKELQVNASPNVIFKAITYEIDKWWTIHSNIANKLNSKLTVRFGETTIKELLVTKLEKDKSLIWKVTKAYIDIEELTIKDEWVETEIKWEITPAKQGSYIHFIHLGLTPEFQCYDACEGGWNFF
ncbi:hypothetical protein [Flavivirga algicola]|uniref:SRPBCC domain-containing protein n=1 Tax=Flavivirga algicola TaxID=2729136 RepID=A0ABX1RU54_9FLAO|nr:hypothetical protein [Flavivirga algicola]NMH86603.1 hypothetical protein [Flavivirga algicola]